MKNKIAAGLLMCRISNGELEFFLVHPGGPFFSGKDAGVWSIPKGLPEGDEGLIDTACREFHEETGITPRPPFHPIGSIRQKAGKTVHAWAFGGEWNEKDGITCNTFRLEWPPRSGKFNDFPEVDRAAWLRYDAATRLIKAEQIPFLDRASTIFSDHRNGVRSGQR